MQKVARIGKQNFITAFAAPSQITAQASWFLQMQLIYSDISDIPIYLDKTM